MLTLLFPLAASLLYVVGALFVKRASDLGVGIWHVTFSANLAALLVFAGFWSFGGNIPSLAQLYQPAVVGLVFVTGQVLVFLALDKGDVSIATPVLGTKIIVVAALQTLLTSDPVTPALWFSAALATGAVILLNSSGKGEHHHVGFTIVISFLSGTAYALFDVLVQRWSGPWGEGRFLPLIFLFVGIYSCGFIFLFKTPLRKVAAPARRPLILGALFMALQALCIVFAIAAYGRATEMNVVYAARGLWSVIAVWLVGHWFANREQTLGRQVMLRRFLGAALLLVAIIIILV